LDYYKSENFKFSFLEMPTEEVDTARVNEALKDLEMMMQVEKNAVAI